MAQKLDRYLSKLQFDPKLLASPMARWIQSPRLVFLAILSLLTAGMFAFSTLPRELTPEIEIPLVTVQTVLPGATPLDVESLITNKLEKEINSIADIDSVRSTSRESLSTIVVQFASNVDPDKALDQVRQKVDLVTDLPEAASVPRVAGLDFNDQPILQVALVGDVDRRSLSRVAEEVQRQAEGLAQIRSVNLSGQEIEEIIIDLDPQLISGFGISSDKVAQAIRANDLLFPLGSIQINQTQYQLSVDSAIESLDTLRQIPIAVEGQSVLLGDIATIYVQAAKSDTVTTFNSPEVGSAEPAVQLDVFKTRSATITDAAQAAEAAIASVIDQYPDVNVVPIVNNGQDIADQFSELTSNFRDTIILVFLVLFIFLGLRQAGVAALSIPLTFLSAFIIMDLTGISLNFLSLFSLLLALGLVVDDAIVIVQAMFRYGQKFPPLESGTLVFRDFVVPIWSTTITTVWAFLPLLLATGIIGEFIRTIPIVVSAALLSSTAIAVFLNLPVVVIISRLQVPQRVKTATLVIVALVSVMLVFTIVRNSSFAPLAIIAWVLVLILLVWNRRKLRSQAKQSTTLVAAVSRVKQFSKKYNLIEQGLIDFSPVARRYETLMLQILKQKKLRVAVYVFALVFFGISLVFLASGLLKTEFFPKTDEQQLYVNVQGPVGWPVERTQQVLSEVEAILLETPELQHLVSQTNSVYSGDRLSSQFGPHLANTTMVLKPDSERSRTSFAIAEDLRDQFATFTQATVTVVEQSGGPPVGADLEVSIAGESLETIDAVATDFVQLVEAIPGAVNVESSLKQTAGKVVISLDPKALQMRNLSAAAVGSWLRTAVSGSETGQITLSQRDIDIVVRTPDENQTLSQLQNLLVPGPAGFYTLAELAQFSLETSPESIEHTDLDRVVKVTAGGEGVSAPELLTAFEAAVADYQLPADVTWSVGGVNQENQASTLSIIQAMGVSVILILVTMVLQLSSFRQAVLVLSVIPLAVAGVFFNFTIFGIPLSFPALIGVLALFGIVVNNSIMLTEKINQHIRFGIPFSHAITSACSSRVEAIFFTTMTTIFGLLPITLADPLWRGLGGAIIAGLSVSGILILFVLPVLYFDVFASRESKANSK